MRAIRIVAVFALALTAGCSSKGSSSSGQSSGGEGGDGSSSGSGSNGDGLGLLTAFQTREMVDGKITASSSFGGEFAPQGKLTNLSHACRLGDLPLMGNYVDAGTLKLTGAKAPISATDESGRYSFSATQSLWSAGTKLTASATGAAVPSFSLSVSAPKQPMVIAPQTGGQVTLGTTGEIEVVWSGAEENDVLLLLSGGGDTGLFVACEFPGSAGKAILVDKDLAALASGDYSMTFYGISRNDTSAGAYDVELWAMADGLDATGTDWGASLTLQ